MPELVQGSVGSRGTVDPRALRDLAIVRYDALSEMSGQLSFSVALLNSLGDGVVLSSINGRTETRTYAKIIRGGTGGPAAVARGGAGGAGGPARSWSAHLDRYPGRHGDRQDTLVCACRVRGRAAASRSNRMLVRGRLAGRWHYVSYDQLRLSGTGRHVH